MTDLTIAFRHFWPGFDPHRFFLPLLANATGANLSVKASTEPRVDVLVESVFAYRNQRDLLRERVLRPRYPRVASLLGGEREPKADLRIWYTGENRRPPRTGYDVTLSFDLESFEGSNIYCPLVYQCIDWYVQTPPTAYQSPEVGRLGMSLPPAQVTRRRENAEEILQRPLRACAVISNPEPYRLRALDVLSRYIPIEIFGSVVGRPIASKVELLGSYRFSICFENDLYPGYVTEKAVEAWAMGCIPIWRGLDPAGVLNPDALLNAADFGSLHQLGEMLVELSPEQTVSMYAQPIVSTQRLNIRELERAVRSAIHESAGPLWD